MVDYIIIGLLILFCFLTIRREVRDYKKGIRCDVLMTVKTARLNADQMKNTMEYKGKVGIARNL